MEPKKDLLSWQWPFFLIFFLINFVGLTLTEYFGRDEFHLYFNKFYHNSFTDYFFKIFTDFATTDVLIVILVFIIIKGTWKQFLFLGLTTALSSLASNLIKRSLFVHVHRPTHYFRLKNIPLRLVEGVESQIPYTFPSGHAVLAAILCFYLCLHTKNRYIQIVLSLLMALVSVSRVYLSKHFVIDTIGGSMLGLFFAILGYYLIWNNSDEKLNRKIIAKK